MGGEDMAGWWPSAGLPLEAVARGWHGEGTGTFQQEGKVPGKKRSMLTAEGREPCFPQGSRVPPPGASSVLT